MPKTFDSWKHLRRLWQAIHNRQVNEYFGKFAKEGGLNNAKSNIKTACLIRPTDSAIIHLCKSFVFQFVLGHYNWKYPPIASFPEWYQIRIGGDRPQLVVQYAEKLAGGKLGRTRWSISIPHYIGDKNPKFPTYKKGQWELLVTLRDNSKIMLNCISKEECERTWKEIKPYIKPYYLVTSQVKIGPRKGKKLKQCNVVATNAKYFAKGQQNGIPTWVKVL